MRHSESGFGLVHPIVQFVYFTIVLLLTMVILHPLYLGLSLISALIYVLHMSGRKAVKPILIFLLPMFVLIALINPLFNHAGVTIWFYLPSGNPFTMESLLFGFNAGFTFSAILLWCMGMRYTLSSDRIIYLFGRAAPRLGLFLSMTLRFLPKMSSQFREIRASQHGIGRDLNQGSLPVRFRNAMRILSSLVSWILESTVETADSLKSRGYGLPRRTSYHLFRFTLRDGILLGVIVLSGSGVVAALFNGWCEFEYYPMLSELTPEPLTLMIWVGYAVLCLLPTIIGWKEGIRWKSIHSKT